MRLRLGLVAVTAGWVLAVSGVAGAAESGADFVVDASPGPGGVVVSSPEELTIQFAEPVVNASIRLFDEAGTERAVAVAEPAGPLVAGTPELLGDGRYLLAWEATGQAAGRVSGAFVFAVDASATGAVIIDREVAGSGDTDTMRILGIGAAGVGWALLAGSLLVATLQPHRASRRLIGSAGVLMGLGALLGLVGAGGGFGGSSLVSGFDTTVGRGWLVVLVASLAVPYLVVQWGSDDAAPRRASWRLIAGGAVIVAAGGLLVATTGEDIPVLPAAAIGVAAVVAVAAGLVGRTAVAAVGAIAVIGLVGLIAIQDREYGFVYRDDLGPVLLEVAVDPARRGVNELHLYGFDAGGGLAELGDTTAWVTHLATDVGPMEIPLLRAGPNHFLTYGAELPLPGTWEIEMHTSTADSVDLETTAIVELR